MSNQEEKVPGIFIKNALSTSEPPDETRRTKAELEIPDPSPERTVGILKKTENTNE